MIRTCIAALSLFASSLSVAGDTSSYILPAEKGAQLLKQCSRRTPQDVKSFFTPDASDVAGLEERLPAYLNRVKPTIRFQDYDRQYVGFTQDGRRYLYGNFFGLGSTSKYPSASSEPVVVCDGGERLWGVVYNLDSKTFEDIRFNGFA
jgi:hypothetical protein